ncbi:cysteine protease [Lithospermum erythrorhizon]|uniref:Cysteine protease n=1 Tax=Lithospermum erythrorhizon TaxID=34254 RepID=A0AAV3P611_LITER
MVKTKHHRPKINKQSHAKKHGKQADISEFRVQLDALGLKIIQVTADGNCFFRALADQLEGNEDKHEKYRDMVVQFIRNNREMFEPFIEDEVPFDEYCLTMGKDGTWAGHMEVQAASLVTRANICIHLHLSPRWYIKNFDNNEARMIHLSYHDGEHYNSVRAKEDSCTGAARPVIIKADADLSAASHQAKTVAAKSKPEAGNGLTSARSIKMVIFGSGCDDPQRVEQVLKQMGGDVDAAIEYLIAEKGSEDCNAENDEISCLPDSSHVNSGQHQDESEQSKFQFEENACEENLSRHSVEKSHIEERLHHGEKKIPRNKACPCGSKKKYKSCCGSTAGKSVVRIAVNQTADYGKGRKGQKQGKKGVLVNAADSVKTDGRPLDMGALCI